MILFGGGLACCCIIKKPWYEWKCMRRRPAHNESGFPNSKGPEPRDSNGCRISLLCKKMQKRSLFYNSAVWSCLNSTPNATLTERPTSCKPRRKLSLKDICMHVHPHAVKRSGKGSVKWWKKLVVWSCMFWALCGLSEHLWDIWNLLICKATSSRKGMLHNPKRALNLSCEQRSLPFAYEWFTMRLALKPKGCFPKTETAEIKWNIRPLVPMAWVLKPFKGSFSCSSRISTLWRPPRKTLSS